MPYPDNFSSKDYDDAQGRDDDFNPDEEHLEVTEAIRKVLTEIYAQWEILHDVDSPNDEFVHVVQNAAMQIELALLDIEKVMP